jgi:N6-adenosine-specific RNA methylase IME4
VRRGAYDTARDAWRAPLRKLPVASLAAASGAVVAVWVTNDRKVADWVSKTLFRAWGVQHVGTWYWLKCASDGSPVLPLDEHAERKPWEPLVVGVVNAAGAVDGDAWAPRGASWLRRVPVRRAVASVPGTHSIKPRLDAALAPCFRAGAPPFRGLELFGRGAFESWTVAGDQALPLVAI